MGGVRAAMAATSLDNCMERKHKSSCKCERVWEAGGGESLTPLIKNNRINSIIFWSAMEEEVGCTKQHQGETNNQPEDWVMLGEEAGLPSQRQGSRKKIGPVT
jgi:hypothetical protein